ncbi:CaiB/BaiF CoA transferase family protein [Thermodesulfobacteriota bacterium]
MNNPESKTDEKPMPLEGIRVVEYAVFHAGPGAGAILADLGAEVIKVENDGGDPVRQWTLIGNVEAALSDGQSIWHQISNRNKKAIYLDIKKEQGRRIFHKLIKEADVFLTNLRKSTKEELGLDYAAISRVNPKIIHASVSGFGPEGSAGDIGAFDPLGQARTGMMYATGSQEPALFNFGVLDQSTAIAASHSILTALLVRERKGIGQEVHISLLSTGLWLMYGNMMMIAGLGRDPNVGWSRLDNSPLRNRFRCKDGKWIMSTHHPEGRYWPSFCEATGQTALLKDSRFFKEADRQANCRDLVYIFDKVFATKTCDEWMEIFEERGLMFSPVQHSIDLFQDPQALINNYLVDFDHPVMGKIKIPGYPAHFSANQAGTRTAAPAIGEHTSQILKEMGYQDEEIEKLKEEKVIK